MANEAAPVLTLDGPSGSGKGTVGQILALRLGWHFLDSGAIYRCLGLLARERGVSLDDAAGLAALAAGMELRFEPLPEAPARVFLYSREVGEALRTEACAAAASQLAALPAVRRALLQVQRDFRRPPGLVADGRDMGTTVFPDATLKIFLLASPEIRAQRRYKQLKEKGFDVNLARLVGEIRERDHRDRTRATSPLRPAEDAYVLDTSELTIAQVVETVYKVLEQRLGG